MTWFKVDDQLHSHPKPEEARLEAIGLWVLGGSYCAAYLTDGFISVDRVRRIAGSRGAELAKRLVKARLWDPADGGWQYHDWATYQPTKAEVLAERERKQVAGRKGGLSKAGATARAVAPARQQPLDAALPPIRSRSDPDPSRAGEVVTKTAELPARATGESDPASSTQEELGITMHIRSKAVFRNAAWARQVGKEAAGWMMAKLWLGSDEKLAWVLEAIDDAAAKCPADYDEKAKQGHVWSFIKQARAPRAPRETPPSGVQRVQPVAKPGQYDWRTELDSEAKKAAGA